LNIWGELVLNLGKKKALKNMLGNVELLTDFSNGKNNYSLYIPLNFWFCLDSGIALPIVAMIHNDIKIHVQFNDFNKCYLQSPTNYINTVEPFSLFKENEIIRQTIAGNTTIGRFIYFDSLNNNLYYIKIKDSFQIPSTSGDKNYAITGDESGFVQNLNSTSLVVSDEDYFIYNTPAIKASYLLVNYIYLDNSERFLFMNNEHEYLVPVVQNIQEQTFYTTNISYKIPFVNPIKIIFWRTQLTANYNSNDLFNYTLNPISTNISRIIDKEYVVLNSVNRIELSKPEYYTNIQIYQNKFTSPPEGIHMYSFCINPMDYQPSGTMNFSKIDDAYLQISFNKLINYQNPVVIKAYGIQLNIFRVLNGLGGLGYYL
jgi:hypothetical protein